MYGKQSIDSLDFNNQAGFDEQVHSITRIQSDLFINNWKSGLTLEAQIASRQLITQAFLIGGFKQTGAQITMNFDGRANNFVGEL